METGEKEPWLQGNDITYNQISQAQATKRTWRGTPPGPFCFLSEEKKDESMTERNSIKKNVANIQQKINKKHLT